MYTIGKLNTEIYKCIATDITPDEVIITDERINHINERHPQIFLSIFPYLRQAIENSDFIIADKKYVNMCLILKSVETKNLLFEVVLHIHTSIDDPMFKSSILSAWTISRARWNNYIKNRKILYSREYPC